MYVCVAYTWLFESMYACIVYLYKHVCMCVWRNLKVFSLFLVAAVQEEVVISRCGRRGARGRHIRRVPIRVCSAAQVLLLLTPLPANCRIQLLSMRSESHLPWYNMLWYMLRCYTSILYMGLIVVLTYPIRGLRSSQRIFERHDQKVVWFVLQQEEQEDSSEAHRRDVAQ